MGEIPVGAIITVEEMHNIHKAGGTVWYNYPTYPYGVSPYNIGEDMPYKTALEYLPQGRNGKNIGKNVSHNEYKGFDMYMFANYWHCFGWAQKEHVRVRVPK